VLEGLKPKAAADARVPIAGTRMMALAVYVDEEHDSNMMLLMMGDAFAGQEAGMRQQLQQAMAEEQVEKQEEVEVEETYEKEFTVRGQPATFRISRGKGAESGSPRVQATGVFPGKSGPAMLMLNVDAEHYSEDDVLEMLGSIQ
jgi:gamma-glutamyl phosphate reductase